jgi:hypothetical protein
VYLSWKAGRKIETPEAATWAEGLMTRVPFDLTFGILREHIDGRPQSTGDRRPQSTGHQFGGKCLISREGDLVSWRSAPQGGSCEVGSGELRSAPPAVAPALITGGRIQFREPDSAGFPRDGSGVRHTSGPQCAQEDQQGCGGNVRWRGHVDSHGFPPKAVLGWPREPPTAPHGQEDSIRHCWSRWSANICRMASRTGAGSNRKDDRLSASASG